MTIDTEIKAAGDLICKECKGSAIFKIVPVGIKGIDDRSYLSCMEDLGKVLLKTCFHSYIVRNMEWEEEGSSAEV